VLCDKRVAGVNADGKGLSTMGIKASRPIVIRRAPGRPREGRLILPGGVRRAALGRSGIKALKREGDGGTPLGCFPIRQVLYRADRGPRPRTRLPIRAIRKDDGWCDDPSDRNYNRLVKLPSRRSAEGLMRADPLYDLVLVLGYNDRPRIKGKGSAIFVHLARPGLTPTDGCIALSRPDLRALIACLHPDASLTVMR
jgi:L,D-peptidoglycan transpeptidase YkuD (ErfK/YbiS/YcfS/YnhG family)